VSTQRIGRPRPAIDGLPAYRPGKGAKQAEAEHGITNAIKLASNENPDHPIDPIMGAIQAAIPGLNRYADHRATAVREAIAEWVGVDVGQVTVGNGSVGLLYQLAVTYVDPGDEVVFPWRSFEAYPVFTGMMAGTAVTVPLSATLGYDLEALAAVVGDRTKLVFIATPNNPTGVATPTADLARFVERIPDHVVVVIDEAYREFLDPSFGNPVAELVPRFDNVLVTRTFSKAHGLAGLRLGYAVGHPDVVSAVDKTLAPFAVNALAQVAALAAIEHEPLVAERCAAIVAERGRVETALAAVGWTFPDHQTNFVWLTLGAATDAVALGLEQRGVVVRPFSDDGIRITIGAAAENDRFVTTLQELVDAGLVVPR